MHKIATQDCKYLLVDTINNFYDIRKELYDIEDFYKQIECDIEEQNPKWVLIDHFNVFSTHSKKKIFQESSDKFISFLDKKKICLIVVSCKCSFEYRNDFEIFEMEKN